MLPFRLLPALLLVCGALTGVSAVAAADATDELAEDLYLLHCAGCHRPHGRGAPGIPGLWNDPGHMVQVEGGRGYLVRVPGAAQSPISDAELHLIINWMLQAFNGDTLPEDFQPLSVEEVSAARADILPDPLKFRERLWRRVQAAGLAAQ